ncbi:MAG: DUF523 domain-containing protein [Thermoanaerobacteraceae bacterium]|nr:DUF523 domain-containing protein [Thermoanaerobacteraceae bacterium]
MGNDEKILVSACLAGFNCKYNGGNNKDERIVKLVMDGKAIPVCPEQLGGLSTPRNPSEIKVLEDGSIRVYDTDGIDVTREFYGGARETLKLAELYGIRKAILKARSPSCGTGKIYSGDFSGRLIEGDGITAKLLKDNGIIVINDEELEKRTGF